MPAYCVRGDDVTGTPSGSHKGHPTINVEDTHPYEMYKYINVGCIGLDYRVQYRLRAELWDSPHKPCCQGFTHLEVPTAYLNSNFDQVTYLDPTMRR